MAATYTTNGGGVMNLYSNLVLIKSGSCGGGAIVSTNGWYYWLGFNNEARIDDVRLHNTDLTGQQITNIFNGGPQ
jgi:hypothetical protein